MLLTLSLLSPSQLALSWLRSRSSRCRGRRRSAGAVAASAVGVDAIFVAFALWALCASRISPTLRRPSATAARASAGSGRSPPAGHQRISVGALAPACFVSVGKRVGFAVGAFGAAGARFGCVGCSGGGCPAGRRGGRRPSVRGGNAGARLPAEPLTAPQAAGSVLHGVLLCPKHERFVDGEPLAATEYASSA